MFSSTATLAYVSDFFSGLVMLDLTDRDNPVTLSSLEFVEGLHIAWTNNGCVYCNQAFGGPRRPLHIVDARDPSSSEFIRSFRARIPLGSPAIGPNNPNVGGDWLYWSYV